MKTVVSAYAASPAHTNWDPDFEERFLAELVGLDGVDALELPWVGRLHPHDDDWLVSRLPSTEVIVTGLPWTLARARAHAGYGLSSPDDTGRAAAIDDVLRMNRDLRRLPLPPSVVLLHTAPRGRGGTAEALSESLATIAAWEWRGATLAVEHCDSPVASRPFEKGFLDLGSELAAVSAVDDVGVWLNWGRSALELRDAATVTAHVADAARSGRLLGLTLSGASAADGVYGAAWSDAHLPFAETDAAAGSLLDRTRARDAITAAGEIPWHGLKVSRRPGDRSVADVVATVSRNLALLREAEGALAAVSGAVCGGGVDG